MTDKAFTTWTKAGCRYLAFPHDDGYAIVDEYGGFYGVWRDAATFRDREPEPPLMLAHLCYRVTDLT